MHCSFFHLLLWFKKRFVLLFNIFCNVCAANCEDCKETCEIQKCKIFSYQCSMGFEILMKSCPLEIFCTSVVGLIDEFVISFSMV
jgi:hypothetical protein